MRAFCPNKDSRPLKKGDCDILAEFIADDGKKYGAYFLYVTRE